MHIERISNKPITIVDIDEIDGLGDEAHPAYRVTFGLDRSSTAIRG